jgi:hypothetical protein
MKPEEPEYIETIQGYFDDVYVMGVLLRHSSGELFWDMTLHSSKLETHLIKAQHYRVRENGEFLTVTDDPTVRRAVMAALEKWNSD